MENSNYLNRRKSSLSLITSLNKDVNSMIGRIFHKNQSGLYTSLIEEVEYIETLYKHLLTSNEDDQIQILNFLKFALENNINNAEIFNSISTNIDNIKLPFSLILLKIFIGSENKEIHSLIKDIFEILLNNININAFNYEYVYQNLVIYFRQNDKKITVDKMSRYLDILKILYGERINASKPKNYFYFSGNACIKVQSKYFEEEKIKISNGCVISLWFKQESYPNNELNHTSDLIFIKFKNNQKLQLTLNNNKLIIKHPSQNNEHIYRFLEGWNNITLMIRVKNLLRDTEINLIFKETSKSFKYSDLTCDSDISEISFFQNFIGQVSTIMFFNKVLTDDSIKILKKYNHGFYSEKKWNEFLKIGLPTYLNNSNYQFNNIKISQRENESVKDIIDSLKFMYIPSRYHKDNTIYDVTGKYHASLTTYNILNGFHNYSNLQSNIQYIGGIKNLIPILELYYTSKCLNEDLLFNYFELIYFILNYKKINMENALESNFFKIISIFLEKFPNEIFTEKILVLFLNIGKSLFSTSFDCELSIQYFDDILLNEKIFIKFPISLQIFLWKNLYQFYISDISQIKTFMKMKRLIILLRYYDQQKYVLFCCSEHASQLDEKQDLKKIMNPPLSTIIENLVNISQLIIDETTGNNTENIKQLLNILILDFSPCIIKRIIGVLLNFFKNLKIEPDLRKIVINELISKDFIEVILFAYSISLLDVRVEIIKFFYWITSPIFKDTLVFGKIEKILMFLKDSPLPNNIKVKANVFDIEIPLRERSSGITKKTGSNKLIYAKTKTCLGFNKDKISDFEKVDNIQEIKGSGVGLRRNPTMEVIQETKESLPIITERSELNDTQQISNDFEKRISDIVTVESELKKYNQMNIMKDEDSKSNKERILQEIERREVDLTLNMEDKASRMYMEDSKTNKVETSSNQKKIIAINGINDYSKALEIKDTKDENEGLKLSKIELSKPKLVKKSISGFTNARMNRINNLDKEFSPDRQIIINIDTDDINQLYKYGGEKHQKNISIMEENLIIEKNISDLAKHCVDYLIGKKSCCECNELLEENKIDIETVNNINDELKKKNDEAEKNEKFRPKSVRGQEKISFSGLKNTGSVLENINQFDKNGSACDNLELDKKKIKIEEYDCNNLENLEKYLNQINYKINLEKLYSSLIDWLIYKSRKSIGFDETDSIINPYVLDVIIKICIKSDYNFVLKCLEDLYILLLNTKENSSIITKNCLLYPFLIETAYKFFQITNETNEKNQINSLAISILIICKKIHTDLILNSIVRDEKLKTDPINKLHFLLSWGIFFKNLYSNRKKNIDINNFIKNLFIELISNFKQKLKPFSPSLSFSIWENYIAFSILIYEFMIFYGLNFNFIFSICDDETIVVPKFILTGLNLQLDMNKEQKSGTMLINQIWSDFKIFESNYSIISSIFGKKFFNDDKYSTLKFEKIIDDIIFNKKKKDIFIENIKLLFYSFKPNDNTNYNVSFVKTISNTFTILITMLQDEKEIKHWLEEYEKFLIFMIIASSNMSEKDDNNHFYLKVQEISLDIICFGLSFLIDEYFSNNTKTSITKKYFCSILKNVFTLLILIYDKIIEIQKMKKKKFINVLSRVNDLRNNFVYQMFNEIIIDPKTKEPVVTKQKITEFKQSLFIEVPTIFKYEEWRQGLFANPLIKNRIKNLFDFASYENIIKERNEVIKYYRPQYNQFPEEENKDLDKLKNMICNIVDGKIAKFENEFMRMQNKKYNNVIENRYIYKKLKKSLFQWQGFWADKVVYYEETKKLKLKIKNHYTSYFAKPILSPILDIKYYLPKFKKFERKNLFIKNNLNIDYNINLNIEEIIQESNYPLAENSINSTNSVYNFIYDIYKFFNKKIWESYEKLATLSLDYNTPQYFNIFLDSKKNNPNDTIFECCYIKLSHHIKGLFKISKEGLFFRPIKLKYITSENERDVDYDYNNKTCWGSIIGYNEKDKDRIVYKWSLNDLKFIFKRRYYFKKKAIEIFTFNNKSYLFTFKSQQKRDIALNNISQYIENKREIRIDTKESKDKEDLYIGIENLITHRKGVKTLTISSKIDEWVNWQISNFEILMFFNILGNRSFSDINQYPVFPWILTNYNDEKLNLEKDIRDLSSPMGMLEIFEESKIRKELIIVQYDEETFDSSEPKRHYANHYSNPLIIVHFLSRLFPISQTHIELQGNGFDVADRQFFSISNSFKSASTCMGDVRELVPEFFYLPELFLNINNLDFGIKVDNVRVEKVELPGWANNDPYIFVTMMKENLEREEISSKINDWIDLIFGFKQRGKEAEIYGNVFSHKSYEDNVNLNNQDPKDYDCFMQSVEFGLTPSQLLTKHPMNTRNKKDFMKGKQVTECKELKVFRGLSQKNKSKDKQFMLIMKVLDNDKILCLFSNNVYNIYKLTHTDIKYSITVETKQIYNDNDFKPNLRIPSYYSDLSNSPCIIYNNCKIIAQAGYFDGRITVISIEGIVNKSYTYYTDKNYPIVALKMDGQERFVYAGSKIGSLFIYKVNDITWNLHKILNDHYSEISSIAISNTINVVATSSFDGYVNVYTFPDTKIFRSLSNLNTPIEKVFLSAYPIPCLVLHCGKSLKCYSINGKLIYCDIEEYDILSPIVFTDSNFNDYIIYGNNIGELKIRKFPQMTIIHKIRISELKKGLSNKPIKCLALSDDKKLIFFWQIDDSDITIVRDPSFTSDFSTVNLLQMGFA